MLNPAETFRVRQPGGTITLHLPDRQLMVEPEGMEPREVCCLANAVQVLRLNHGRLIAAHKPPQGAPGGHPGGRMPPGAETRQNGAPSGQKQKGTER